MQFTNEDLRYIYDRTSGKCHLCHTKRAFTNYGRFGRRGSWEVEHSIARANGGTHRLNNLYAACISCNRSKGTKSTRSTRTGNGYTRAPLSRAARANAKSENALGAGAAGALVGARFGIPGMLIGAVVGAILGYGTNPDQS